MILHLHRMTDAELDDLADAIRLERLRRMRPKCTPKNTGEIQPVDVALRAEVADESCSRHGIELSRCGC